MRPWTQQETTEVFALRKQGFTYPEIADKLHRTTSSVQSHIQDLAKRGKLEEAKTEAEIEGMYRRLSTYTSCRPSEIVQSFDRGHRCFVLRAPNGHKKALVVR